MPGKTKSIKVSDKKANKPWLKKTTPFEYAIESLDKKKRFLIVCEGQTEALYFKCFPVLTADVKTVHQGTTKLALINCTDTYNEMEKYDEIWCVFDMDYSPGNTHQFADFDNAIQTATARGYKSAYSNDAFELWFVLHFQFVQETHLRNKYFEMLSKHWNMNYAKHGKERKFAQSIYQKLMETASSSQQDAIRNAEKLYEMNAGKAFHLQNPVTTVFLLVRELNLHLRR